MDAAAFRSVYRNLLHLSRRLPNASKRPEAIALVRDQFRLHTATNAQLAASSQQRAAAKTNSAAASAVLDDAERLGKLMAEAESRLGFLKMMTPRSEHRGNKGGTRTLYNKGEKLELSGEDGTKYGAAVSNLLRACV